MPYFSCAGAIEILVKDFFITLVFPPLTELPVPFAWQSVEKLRLLETQQCVKVLVAQMAFERISAIINVKRYFFKTYSKTLLARIIAKTVFPHLNGGYFRSAILTCKTLHYAVLHTPLTASKLS